MNGPETALPVRGRSSLFDPSHPECGSARLRDWFAMKNDVKVSVLHKGWPDIVG